MFAYDSHLQEVRVNYNSIILCKEMEMWHKECMLLKLLQSDSLESEVFVLYNQHVLLHIL